MIITESKIQSPSSSSLCFDIGRVRKMAKNNILVLLILSICNVFINVGAFSPSGWYSAHATFYGNSDASGTMGMVPCKKHGGVRFTINGNVYFLLVLITNVGGAGSIQSVQIKGSNTNWITMPRNWGANWQSNAYLVGQSISFKVTTSEGEVQTFPNIANSYWGIGQTFSSLVQFS
ncbi:hypothetical protein C3L33_09598, partial [Rhododendron williamsianum]